MNRKVIFYTLLVALTGCNSEKGNVALGTLERDRISHTATVNEVIISLPVKQGSKVTEGTVLVEFDSTLQSALVKEAKAEVQQAKANLDKAKNGARDEELSAAKADVEGAKARVIKSNANYKRSQKLVKENLISQAMMDNATAARDENIAQLNSVSEHLSELVNGTRIEDLLIAEAILETKIALLATQQKKLDDLTVTAKRTGILDSLPWNLGERVTAGSPVAIVLAGEVPFARVYIPQPYRVNVKAGDTLPVLVDGLTEQIQGTVRWVSLEPAFTPYYALNQSERSNLMYLAEVLLPQSMSELPSGIPAQVVLPNVSVNSGG
ncbi:MAG: HlyD family secretion protein [Colwellia sp.]